MRRPKKDIQLTSYDELLGLEESPEKSMNQVVEIELELSLIHISEPTRP